MQSNPQAREDFNVVTRDIGVPNTVISDNVGEQTGPQIELHEFICRFCIGGRTTELYSPWQNRSKGVIRILKYKAKRRIICRMVPKCIWYFGLVWEAYIYSRTDRKDGRTPVERLTGYTIDISEWTEFYFYECILLLVQSD